ncbi:MAG: tetratricopeptide repeat protein [Cyclobacteriaceae bacterium]
MKPFILASIFFLLFHHGYGQNKSNLDSLWSIWKNPIQADTARLNAIHKIIKEGYENNNPDSVFYYAQQQFELASSKGLKVHQARALSNKGLSFQFDDYDKALEFFELSLELFEEIGDKIGQAYALNLIGMTYRRKGDLESATEILNRSLFLAKEYGDNSDIAIRYINLGNVYGQRGNLSRALDLYLQSILFFEEAGDQKSLIIAYNNLGGIYLETGSMDKAMKYLSLALKKAQELEIRYFEYIALKSIGSYYMQIKEYDKAIKYHYSSMEFVEFDKDYAKVSSLNTIGKCYFEKGELDLATDYLRRALILAEELGDISGKAIALFRLGSVKYESHNYSSAIKYAKEVLEISKRRGFLELEKDASYLLYLCYKKVEDPVRALRMYEICIKAKDSLHNDEKNREFIQAESEYIFQKEKDSIQFANEREKLILNQEIKERNTLQVATLGAIVALLILLYILYRYYLSKQNANKLLQEQNKEINIQKKELESLDHTKSRFLANISHELRTPLTLISAPSHNLQNLSLPAEALKDVQTVIRNTKKLQVLVDDILDLSKLESNKMELRIRETPIRQALKRITGTFIPLAAHLNINYQVKVNIDAGIYLGLDEEKLEKVIGNLLSNAIKYTPARGLVTTNAKYKDQKLSIEVVDSGAGIPEGDLPRIFDRYFQSAQPEAPLQGGTGIGLALAQEFTQLMGGKLTAQNVQGLGVKFLLDIPCEARKALISDRNRVDEVESDIVDLKQDAFLDTFSEKSHRILVVDDHLEMQQFIASLLNNRFEVGKAVNGKQALALMNEETFDLVISDVMMPEMDGFSFLSALRADARYVDLPVIMLTALNDEGHKLKALSLGVDEYLAKPFSPNELLARVSNMLMRHEVRRDIKGLIKEHGRDEAKLNLEPQENEHKSFIVQVEELIEEELENEGFTLEKAADRFHLGERQFRNRITKITGLSPKKFQREVALQKARKLLEQRVYDNLSAVARSVGIRHTTRFTEYYYQRFGSDPRGYFDQYAS